ncbi:MAG: DUF5654 family protein [Patescibacteria group bacterium]
MSKKRLRLEILEQMATLATAGFGLVAALAWNSAIQDLFAKVNVLGSQDSVAVKFIYAGAVTAIVVLVTVAISRSISKLKE